jgi:xylitol oxidase
MNLHHIYSPRLRFERNPFLSLPLKYSCARVREKRVVVRARAEGRPHTQAKRRRRAPMSAPSIGSAGQSETDESLAPTPEPEEEIDEHGTIQAEDATDPVAARTMEVVMPATIEELQRAVKDADKVRIYSPHRSFATVVDTDGVLICLDEITWDDSILQIDAHKRRVTCSAFMTCSDLAAYLEQQGWALQNLPSSLNISMAGAVIAGAHGSGDSCSMLATSVEAVDYVDADGCLVATTERDLPSSSLGAAADPALQALMLGSLGVLVQLTLRIEPRFHIRQDVYLNIPWKSYWKEAPTFTGTGNTFQPATFDEAALIDDVFAEAYSVSVFVGDWGSDYISQAWFKRKVPIAHDGHSGTLPPAARELFGGRLSSMTVHPIPSESGGACTAQGEPAASSPFRLPHFNTSTSTAQRDDQLFSEYFLPREHAVDALRALRAIAIIIQPVLKVSELRSVSADEFWMSPHYRRPSFAISFVWSCNVKSAIKTLLHIERALMPFAPRPNWGSLFISFGPEIPLSLPSSAKYRSLLVSLDPTGKFRSHYVNRFVFGNGMQSHPAAAENNKSASGAYVYGEAVEGTPRPYDLLRQPARIGGVPENPPSADMDALMQEERKHSRARFENGRLGWKFGLFREGGGIQDSSWASE